MKNAHKILSVLIICSICYVFYICKKEKYILSVNIKIAENLQNLKHFTDYMSNSALPGKINPTVSDRLLNTSELFSILKHRFKQFEVVLKKRANNGTIILFFVDLAFTDMALNLYFSSLKTLKIENYIFVCASQEAVHILKTYNIMAIALWNDSNSLMASDFRTVEFGKKAIRKIFVTLLALELGYKVLFADTDIILLKDPLPYMSSNYSIIFQPDTPKGTINSGFYFAYPTEKVKYLHHTLISRTNCWKYAQQACLSHIADELMIKKRLLPYDLFQSGVVYFDNGKRMFAFDNPCKACVLIHNNWIVSFSNKRYRFKEQLMWHVDHNGYYSNPNAKYIAYDNLIDFGPKKTKLMETNALRTAFFIAFLLNRIVIFPKFSCYGCKKQHCQKITPKLSGCAAHVQYDIKILDKVLGTKYRENMFLNHTLVPNRIKMSVTDPIFIEMQNNSYAISSSKNIIFYPRDVINGATKEEFLTWLTPYSDYSVIKFHTLYGHIMSYRNISLNKILNQALLS